MHNRRALSLAFVTWPGLAFGYETDQLTYRTVPLDDETGAANARVDELLDLAIAETNARTQCHAPASKTREVLADRIREHTASRTHIPDRGLVRGFGFGSYSAWLETAPIERRSFLVRDDVYADVGPTEGFILNTVGTCSTVKLNGVLVGTDKPDHFFSEGYNYAVRSRWGDDPQRAIEYGTRTERSIYGMMTSSSFSYADLSANYEGYRFFSGLLGPDSIARIQPDGCVARVGSFDWADYVDWTWDEVLNPPVLTRSAATAVDRRLDEQRDVLCRDYGTWGEGYPQHLEAVLATRPTYAGPKVPSRRDPWRLPDRCGPLEIPQVAEP